MKMRNWVFPKVLRDTESLTLRFSEEPKIRTRNHMGKIMFRVLEFYRCRVKSWLIFLDLDQAYTKK